MYPELTYRRLQAGPSLYRYELAAEAAPGALRRFVAGLGATIFTSLTLVPVVAMLTHGALAAGGGPALLA